MPLAIELAAARVRALSPIEILDSLHDRFRLLTGGARTAVRRQQTLRASVDWSHALMTEPERILFRRLAVFMGGFDVDAARAACGDDIERYQMLDELTLLVDKSLVVAESTGRRTRYRLLETIRQYALEKLAESGEAEGVRSRHRDYFASMAATLEAHGHAGHDHRVEQAEAELDNLRAAFRWSLENSDIECALNLVSSLEPLWLSRGFIREGLSWLAAGLADMDVHQADVAPAVRVRAIVDKALLLVWLNEASSIDEAKQALITARELDDPALLIRALAARAIFSRQPERFVTEAAELARQHGDSWMLSQILGREALMAMARGDPVAASAAATEGLHIAETIGDRFNARACRIGQGWARAMQSDLAGAVARFGEVIDDATAMQDAVLRAYGLVLQSSALAYSGDIVGAHAAADELLQESSELGGLQEAIGQAARAIAYLAAGDGAAARQGFESARERRIVDAGMTGTNVWSPLAPLVCGDLATARRWADELVSVARGAWVSSALAARAHVEIAQGQPEQAERDAHEALGIAARVGGHIGIPLIFECLAALASDGGSHVHAARLFGAADAIWQRTGAVRFKILDADHEARVAVLRDALGHHGFEAAWAEGAALSTDEAIAYAQRGHGERKRPSTGWASLTPTEASVVNLVREGLSNKDIAARLFVSPRTVQSHLTHVYTKLGITSRVQLAQEAAHHA
jgi:predicted ATPase/DNA-binding CsgD family transcriptional regulator